MGKRCLPAWKSFSLLTLTEQNNNQLSETKLQLDQRRYFYFTEPWGKTGCSVALLSQAWVDKQGKVLTFGKPSKFFDLFAFLLRTRRHKMVEPWSICFFCLQVNYTLWVIPIFFCMRDSYGLWSVIKFLFSTVLWICYWRSCSFRWIELVKHRISSCLARPFNCHFVIV